jgi:fructokinase
LILPATIRLLFIPNKAYTPAMRIGIDLGGTKIEGILLSPEGDILLRKRIATPRGDYGKTLRAIAALVAELEKDLPGRPSVGMGIPGTISPATGLVKNANSTWLIGKPLDRDLAELLDRPVRLANDADCLAISEASDGAAAKYPNVFGVILGTGVGGGLVVGGKLVSGPNAIAGEWGHNPLPAMTPDEAPGLNCYCGREGCIETFLAGPSLRRDHGIAFGKDLPAEEIALAANAETRITMARYEDRLARALASVINIFDPHAIVIGGGLSKVKRLFENVPRIWDRYVFSDTVETKLLPPKHGDSSGVRGAAWLWPEDGRF